MKWSSKRQLIVFTVLAILFFSVILYFMWPYISKKATCFDGKKNADELGIDCSGSCTLVCKESVQNPRVLWSASSEIIPGRYNAVALVENPNNFFGTEFLRYEFKLYDKDGVFIASRRGSTFIGGAGETAIFEGAIVTANREPTRTTFTILAPEPVWKNIQFYKDLQLAVLVEDITFSRKDSDPLITAKIKNRSIYQIKNFEAVAIVYNSKGNMITNSRTFIQELESEGEATISFTWPKPFVEEPTVVKIIPRISPFNTD